MHEMVEKKPRARKRRGGVSGEVVWEGSAPPFARDYAPDGCWIRLAGGCQFRSSLNSKIQRIDSMHLEKRILVTGGAGFLGSHLCERLITEGSQVLCVDNFFTGARKNVESLLDHKYFGVFVESSGRF